MDQSNIIDLNQYRKSKKHKLESFAFRVKYDETAYKDALMLLIFTCSLAALSFFFIFYFIYKLSIN
ncbi:hypothetical protein AN960_19890 [Bacillus sp. FJAT-25509]|uniref:hypothetical protein n=1 Tax=Bacillaceae TaxID=186817 RepID=UPI0006FEC1C7|nr:hypothetical protein [Bacillus sp. FJAT-25509]KQL33910.1 hypothetical protein AN960_19890 [Bacillus sp. FJAT-25509]